jgi:hypothetical protein
VFWEKPGYTGEDYPPLSFYYAFWTLPDNKYQKLYKKSMDTANAANNIETKESSNHYKRDSSGDINALDFQTDFGLVAAGRTQ